MSHDSSVETFKVGPLTVRIGYDQDAGNPCEEDDGLGTIRSFSRKHINYIDPDEAREMMEADPCIVPLAYYEHGNCLWMVAEGPHPAGVEFQWDGTRFAGIWIPDDWVRESYQGQDSKTRQQWMVERAASCCKVYTKWCNGEIYYFVVTDEDDEVVDSCSGMYSLEYCIDYAREAAESAVARRTEEDAKISAMMGT